MRLQTKKGINEMKHYTSTELKKLMATIGYHFDKDSSYKGYLVFITTTDGWTAFNPTFNSWKEVAEWYRAEKDNW